MHTIQNEIKEEWQPFANCRLGFTVQIRTLFKTV